MLKISLFTTGIMAILLSCSTTSRNSNKLNNTPTENLHVSKNENAENKILFLTLGIALADSARDEYKFTLINSVFGNGKLTKNSFNNDVQLAPYHLYCEITDATKKRTEWIEIKNPLLKVFEYSPDKTTLEKRLVVSKAGEIFLRFQFSKNSKFLTIYKPQADLRTLKKIYHAQI